MNDALTTFRARLLDIEMANFSFAGITALWDEFEVDSGGLSNEKIRANSCTLRFDRSIFSKLLWTLVTTGPPMLSLSSARSSLAVRTKGNQCCENSQCCLSNFSISASRVERDPRDLTSRHMCDRSQNYYCGVDHTLVTDARSVYSTLARHIRFK